MTYIKVFDDKRGNERLQWKWKTAWIRYSKMTVKKSTNHIRLKGTLLGFYRIFYGWKGECGRFNGKKLKIKIELFVEMETNESIKKAISFYSIKLTFDIFHIGKMFSVENRAPSVQYSLNSHSSFCLDLFLKDTFNYHYYLVICFPYSENR